MINHFVGVFNQLSVLASLSAVVSGITGLGRGYIGTRTDTIQQSGQTPDREAEMNPIAVYVRGYTEADPTGMLSPNNSRLSDPTKWICFEPTVWPGTYCSWYRIRLLLQWVKRIL
jgi:hypothetical protein